MAFLLSQGARKCSVGGGGGQRDGRMQQMHNKTFNVHGQERDSDADRSETGLPPPPTAERQSRQAQKPEGQR